MPPRKKTTGATPIETVKHKDKRVNIPTEELRDFVAEDEAKPKTVLYPRDPSLDPQLVWKGKDEQDQSDLAVPAVPIYIQEKIHPQAIIENVRAEAKKDAPEAQFGLFSDFNGIKFEDLIEFYSHEQNWSNRMILGDSLLAMTSLAEKEGLKGKVQMIYLDPPYGIKFGSNWQVSTRKRDVKDGKAEDASRQPEQVKAFRDTWKLGIHSYLAYLRDRLVVARELLTETGSCFIQIGDENVHLVRNIMDEVFGSDNFVSLISFATTTGFESQFLARAGDRILWYGKTREVTKYRSLFVEADRNAGASGYRWIIQPDGTSRSLSAEELRREKELPANGRVYAADNILSQGPSSDDQTFEYKGKKYSPGANSHWKPNFPDGMKRLGWAGRLHVSKNSLRYIRQVDDFSWRGRTNVWSDTQTGQFTDEKVYVVQTNIEVIKRCLLMTTDPGDLVLDPTCGSGTTAYVAEQWGRRWITMDTSRVALALARTRLMAAKYPYYLLADSPEGIKKEAELTGKLPPDYKTEGDIKKGFVYKRVPHVTLKSIANNPDIKEGMTRDEIDAAIARHADTEILYDQPYEDNKRIRVTGPFTVESLSPHRAVDSGEWREDGNKPTTHHSSLATDFVHLILDNLKKAGVQNTVKGEKLKFDRLEPYAGQWLHAEGEYTEADGKSRRVAVCIGPEHGTVGPQLVKEAAKEAVQGVGFDLLVVCGFAFDPHVSEEAKRYGKLTVLITRMNPDLAMGDELLKKTGAGNLFMVFGEPDLKVKKLGDGKLTVEIKGVDVYDPTTGQIRSSSTDDIACWFIDTDYNGESFFVRHAYFTGAEEPYDKLKRALRAEVDESAWATLYSTKSRPFDPPKTGKIAVKVINHYGDEVLKVYNVD
jgi:adenine-specific DNA-methyltransferase